MAKGRIVIREETCKGCALCQTACPQAVIEMATDQKDQGQGHLSDHQQIAHPDAAEDRAPQSCQAGRRPKQIPVTNVTATMNRAVRRSKTGPTSTTR